MLLRKTWILLYATAFTACGSDLEQGDGVGLSKQSACINGSCQDEVDCASTKCADETTRMRGGTPQFLIGYGYLTCSQFCAALDFECAKECDGTAGWIWYQRIDENEPVDFWDENKQPVIQSCEQVIEKYYRPYGDFGAIYELRQFNCCCLVT